jgi:hypothetical protein
MNVCSLSGRLTWPPELRYQANGKPELSFRLSVPNGERDGKRFFLPFDVTVYGQSCESLAESLERDDLVELTGQNTWPKPSRKPGGAAIPAVICFGVTKLSGSVLSRTQGGCRTEITPPQLSQGRSGWRLYSELSPNYASVWVSKIELAGHLFVVWWEPILAKQKWVFRVRHLHARPTSGAGYLGAQGQRRRNSTGARVGG